MYTHIWVVRSHSSATRCVCVSTMRVSHNWCYSCEVWENRLCLFWEPLQHCIFCAINRDSLRIKHVCTNHTLSFIEYPMCRLQVRNCMLSTCSYDEVLRVWDTRHLAGPLGKHAIGGGVWKIKPHSQDPTLLLLAAMYNGFHVLQWDTQHSYSKMLFHPLCDMSVRT